MRTFIKNVLLIILFAGAYFVLEVFLGADTPVKQIDISVGFPFLVFLSIVINPFLGALGLALGNFIVLYTLANQIIGNVDWGIIICSFLNCISISLAMKKINLRNEFFGRDQIIYFNRVQIVSNLFYWAGLYPLFKFLLKHGEYLKTLSWGMWQAFGNTLSCLLAATLFIVLYSRSQYTEANFYRS